MILQVVSTDAATGREMNTPTLILADRFPRVRYRGGILRIRHKRIPASSYLTGLRAECRPLTAFSGVGHIDNGAQDWHGGRDVMNKLLILAGCVAGVTASAVAGGAGNRPGFDVLPHAGQAGLATAAAGLRHRVDAAVRGHRAVRRPCDLRVGGAGSGHGAAGADRRARGQSGAEHHLVVVVLPDPPPVAGRGRVRRPHGELRRPGPAGRCRRPQGRYRTGALPGLVRVRHRADRRRCAAEPALGDCRPARPAPDAPQATAAEYGIDQTISPGRASVDPYAGDRRRVIVPGSLF